MSIVYLILGIAAGIALGCVLVIAIGLLAVAWIGR